MLSSHTQGNGYGRFAHSNQFFLSFYFSVESRNNKEIMTKYWIIRFCSWFVTAIALLHFNQLIDNTPYAFDTEQNRNTYTRINNCPFNRKNAWIVLFRTKFHSISNTDNKLFCLFLLIEGYDCMHYVFYFICVLYAVESAQLLSNCYFALLNFSCALSLSFLLSRQHFLTNHTCNWRWLLLLFTIYWMFHFQFRWRKKKLIQLNSRAQRA